MNWFFKWLYNGLKEIESEQREERIYSDIAVPKVARRGVISAAKANSMDGSVNLNQQPLIFKIYPATGGHIVEYAYYNEKTDRHDQALHLIPSDLELGAELAKIMTLEALKR